MIHYCVSYVLLCRFEGFQCDATGYHALRIQSFIYLSITIIYLHQHLAMLLAPFRLSVLSHSGIDDIPPQRWQRMTSKTMPLVNDEAWPKLQAAMDNYRAHISVIFVRTSMRACTKLQHI